MGFYLSAAEGYFPKKACLALTSQSTPAVVWVRHQRHHQEHIPSAEDPMLEQKGQLQFSPKCLKLPLALLHLPTQNQSP